MRTRATTVALLVLGALLTALPAGADVRVVEQLGGAGEAERYLDLFAYAKPAFVWRQNDDHAPVDDDTLGLDAVRLGVHGQAHKWVQIKIEVELFPGPSLTDAYVDFRPLRQLRMRLGQLKVPFLRTFQFGTTATAFNDRLIYTSRGQERAYLRFLKERDIGWLAHGRVGSDDVKSMLPVLEYAAGMLLGRGPNQTRNDDDAFLYAARVQLHALGLPAGASHEGDLARNAAPKVMAGGSVYTNCDDRGQWNRGFTTDIELRWRGIYASGTLVWMKNGASAGLGDTLGYDGACTGVAGVGDHIASGWSAQALYVLPLPDALFRRPLVEIGVRWDAVNPNSPCNAKTGACGVFGGGAATPGYVPPPDYNDGDNAPSRGRLTVGATWYPTGDPLLKLSVNYQHHRESEDVVLAEGAVAGIKNDVLWLQLTAGL